MMEEEEKQLSVKEAAERLKRPTKTVWSWIGDGRIPGAHKEPVITEEWRIPESSLSKIDIPKVGRPRKKESEAS